jgi:hypothetical protein
VLFAADREYLDGNALELIAGIASTVLQRQLNASIHTQISMSARPSSKATGTSSDGYTKNPQWAGDTSPRPSWSDLSHSERDTHVRAQRFARVSVAEMELAKPEASRTGRAQSSLYTFLKPEIDTARERYRQHFMSIPSMVDYLHIELVHTAAEGDESKLGAEYPGPLV